MQASVLYRPTAAPIRGILFAEDFDLPEVSGSTTDALEIVDLEPEHIDPQFNSADLEAARIEAFAAGQAAALTSAETLRKESINATLAAIAQRLSEDRETAANLAESTLNSLGHSIFACLITLLPATCARHDANEIGSLIQQSFVGMVAESMLRVSVAPDAIEDIRTALAGIEGGLLSCVNLVPQPGLDSGDARITWSDPRGTSASPEGGVHRNAHKTREAMIGILVKLGLLDAQFAKPPAARPNGNSFVPPPFLQPRFGAAPLGPSSLRGLDTNTDTNTTLENMEPAHG